MVLEFDRIVTVVTFQVTFLLLKNKSIAIMNKKSSDMFIISNEVVTSDKFPSRVTIKLELDDVTEMEVDEVEIKQEQIDEAKPEQIDNQNTNDVMDDDEVKVSICLSNRLKAKNE